MICVLNFHDEIWFVFNSRKNLSETIKSVRIDAYYKRKKSTLICRGTMSQNMNPQWFGKLLCLKMMIIVKGRYRSVRCLLSYACIWAPSIY